MKKLNNKTYQTLLLPVYFLSLFWVWHVILGGITFLNVLAGEPSADSSCCECHSEICELDLNKTYVHLPFMQQQCPVCHVSAAADVAEETYTSTEKISWIDERFTPAPEHWFVIPAELFNSDRLVVCAHDVMGNSHTERLLLPSIDSISLKVNDRMPPVIKSVKIIGVYQGVLISSRIGWLTDKESDSEVRYGIDTLQYSVKADRFTTNHEIVLQNLRANQKYQYIVISRDILGNRAQSGTAFFSTEELSQKTPKEYEQYQETSIQLDAQFFQNGDSYIVNFSANQPVTLLIGSEKANEREEKLSENMIVNVPDHLPMRSGNELLISVCTGCHAGFADTGNHPVNVYPNGQMPNPVSNTTSPDGCVTCVTCHFAHASEYAYMLRFCYRNGVMKAGSFPDIISAQAAGGCLACHASKGVSPQNR